MAAAEQAVRDYLDLLAAGKADEATRLVPVTPQEEVIIKPEFFTDRVMSSSTAFLTVDKLTTSFVDEETVNVLVAYSIGEDEALAPLTVKADGGWHVVTPLIAWVRVKSSIDTLKTARIGGVTVPIDDADHHSVIGVYPGVYQVTPGVTSKYLTVAKTTVVGVDAGFEPTSEVVLEYQATSALRTKLSQEVKAYLDKCVSSGGQAAESCPSLTRWADAKIKSYPDLDTIDSQLYDVKTGQTGLSARFTGGAVQVSDRSESLALQVWALPRADGSVSIVYA